MENFSNIIVRGEKQRKKVKIGSDLKPEIQKKVIEKWQSLIDTAAKVIDVPAGLIMRLNQENIEVFVKSNTNGNPYEEGEQAELIYGLYCETVIGKQQKLLIPDARKSNIWSKDNPDVDMDMISYMGFPVNWPDGEVFGTVCLLDSKENNYNSNYEELLHQIKLHIENDLEVLLLNKNLVEKNIQLQEMNNIKSKFLSLISHDIRGGVATINEFLKMIIQDFDTFDNNKLKSILQSINEQVTSSHEALEDLLSWSKNDILELQPEIKKVNIIEVIDKLLVYFNQPIQLKGIKVSKSFDTRKVFVNTDHNMILAVLRNLISNAIKYNNQNGELRIKVTKLIEKTEIIIEDTGIGMNQEYVDKLFSYNEKHKKGTRGESSSGLGLILAMEFLSKLKAEVFVKSKIGVGSTFRIEL